MNNIEKLRTILFNTIIDVREKRVDLETAKSINSLCDTVIKTAAIEIEFMRVNNGTAGTSFMLADKRKEIEVGDSEIDEDELTDEQRELLELEKHYGDDEKVYRHTAGQHRRDHGVSE